MDTVSGFPEAQGVCAREARTGCCQRRARATHAMPTVGSPVTWRRRRSRSEGGAAFDQVIKRLLDEQRARPKALGPSGVGWRLWMSHQSRRAPPPDGQ